MPTPQRFPTKDHNIEYIKFGSMFEVVRYIQQEPDYLRLQECSSREPANSWNGGMSFEDAVKAAMYGWPEGMDQIRKLLSQHIEVFKELIPRQEAGQDFQHAPEGIMPDIEKAAEGSPDCWMVPVDHDEEEIVTREGFEVQRVIFSATVPSRITGQTLFMHGCYLVALLEALRLAGISTELVLRYFVRSDSGSEHFIAEVPKGPEGFIIDITVKPFSQAPDMDLIAFCCASPAMLRRIVFAIMECMVSRESQRQQIIQNAYGRVAHYVEDRIQAGDLVIPGVWENKSGEKINAEFVEAVKKHFIDRG